MAEKVEFYRETEFKDTEIGRIPKEWEVVKLGEVCTKIKAGGTPLTSKKEYYNGNIPFVKIEDMTSSYKYIKSTLTSITEAGLKNSSAWLVPVKSLLVAMYGSIGAIAINEIEVATNQAILAILPNNEKTNVEFLFYLLTHLKPLLKKHAKQTTQANLTAEIIKNFKIALPKYFEQQRIAEILSTIDEAIRKTDEAIAKTERLKKGLMQELLTKGIGHKEFKDTEIGRIPKEWEVLELGDEKITVFIKSGNTPSKEIQEYWNGGILFVTQGDMTKVNKYLYETSEKITELGLKNFNLFIIPENSILLSMYGTIGKVVINKNPVTVSQNIAAIKLNNKNADQEYFFYAIQYYSFQFKKKAKISTMKHLNIKIVKKIYLPLPSLQEQQQIALIISTVDKKLGILKQEKVKLERIKQWFMEELLTGRIRVRVS